MHPVFVSTLSWFKKAGEFSLFIFFYKVKYIMEPRSISGNLDQWKLDDLDSYHLAAQNLHPFLSCQVSSPPKKVLHGASPPNIFHIFVNPWSLQQKIILHLMSFCVNCFLFRDFFFVCFLVFPGLDPASNVVYYWRINLTYRFHVMNVQKKSWKLHPQKNRQVVHSYEACSNGKVEWIFWGERR